MLWGILFTVAAVLLFVGALRSGLLTSIWRALRGKAGEKAAEIDAAHVVSNWSQNIKDRQAALVKANEARAKFYAAQQESLRRLEAKKKDVKAYTVSVQTAVDKNADEATLRRLAADLAAAEAQVKLCQDTYDRATESLTASEKRAAKLRADLEVENLKCTDAGARIELGKLETQMNAADDFGQTDYAAAAQKELDAQEYKTRSPRDEVVRLNEEAATDEVLSRFKKSQ